MRIRSLLLASVMVCLAGCASQGDGKKTYGQEQKDLAQRQWAGARAGVLASLAKEQYEGGNFENCRKTIDEALRMDPDNKVLRILSARLAIEQGNLEMADKELVQARRIDPKSAEADYLSGVVCQRWQRSQEAFDYYRSAAEKQPNELAYVMAQAETLVALGRSDDALSLLQAKVVYFEYSATIRDAVGQLLMQKENYTAAAEMLRQATVLASDDNNIREHLAMAHFRAKQYREAVDVFTRLVKDDKFSKRADLFLALGECQLKVSSFRDAREAFETATQLNANQSTAWIGLGKAALQLNDVRRAELALKRTLSLDPSSSEGNLLLGYVRVRQSKWEDALGSFRKASALDPADTVSLCMIGYVLEKTGKNAEAMHFYGQALKIRPGDEMAKRLMAQVQVNE